MAAHEAKAMGNDPAVVIRRPRRRRERNRAGRPLALTSLERVQVGIPCDAPRAPAKNPAAQPPAAEFMASSVCEDPNMAGVSDFESVRAGYYWNHA